ncbi:mitochondrial [4Fe-4S] cluster assembly and transfer protein Isa2 [Schizosaccharomyces osmophilus]|uniref:Mitochondrial [4Fe-4S] cluster assembly and transfer protein Isa2 n=1 Tax=Schizosaccharomyces osmophilus TaxID=2545709 RepID=A0AAE9W7J9_9SCHI|nr:mitochondrial [4Fe-4S] cluster assembly and transfer protein Isa2 [Schizosaccharomyces osmophilus]WBW70885.1 mitochondrial [4Fe-4S] cluster assembly and transfer protein Isa2 [Schizosaccharomyces osmophilus]
MSIFMRKNYGLFPVKGGLNKLFFRNWQVPRNHISSRSFSSVLQKNELGSTRSRPFVIASRILQSENQSKIYRMQPIRKNSTKTADQYTLQEQYDESGKPYIIHMGDSAKQQLEKVAAQKQKDTALRVVVDGGGCHGYQISFNMDDQIGKEDSVFVRGKARIVSDSISLPLINGSEIVYTKELIGSSFQLVNNPRAKSSCGCNVSFDLN